MISLTDKGNNLFNEEIFTEDLKGTLGDIVDSIDPKDDGNVRDAWKNFGSDATPDNFSDAMNKTKNRTDDAAKAIGRVSNVMNGARVNNRSIIARAKNSVLQFPIYITQTCPVAPAHTISKLFERVYASLVQNVIAQYPIINEEEANDLVFLKNFHTNLRESTEEFSQKYASLYNEYYEPIDDIDQMMVESIFSEKRLSENVSVQFTVIPTDNPDIIFENKRLLNEPLTGFSYLQEDTNVDTETEKEVRVSSNQEVVKDEDFRNMAMDELGINSEIRAKINKYFRDPNTITNSNDRKIITKNIQDIDNRVNSIKSDIKHHKKKKDKNGNESEIYPGYVFDGIKYIRKYATNQETTKTRHKRDEKSSSYSKTTDDLRAPELLRDSDVKKINGMLPYSIKAQFIIRSNGERGLTQHFVEYIISIKTVLHLVRSQDIAEDLRELVDGKVKSLQKVRYKTGEISFKDYMFNISGAKKDARKSINYNKKWVNTLKRLSDYNQHYGSYLKQGIQAINKGEVPIPNATLILTQPDVSALTNQTGIDLSKIDNARRLARNMFLIAIAIVDSSAGTMRVFFPDSDTDWDVQSLASVDAEVSKTDNSQLMRELNRMVNH